MSQRRAVNPNESRRPMAGDMINFDIVRKIGLTLPGVEESTAYGQPALKIRGKLLACLPAHRSAQPGSLAVRVDFADRAALLAEAPDIYYLTDHYVDYNAVLVRLARVNPAVLRDLLGMGYKFVTRKAAPRPPARRPNRPRRRDQ
ncbi:MAG: MmcQ/YjbR family DNA-binding protein [Candidatus Acidiferrales bacterium]